MRNARLCAVVLAAAAAGAGCADQARPINGPLIEDNSCSDSETVATGRLTNRSDVTHTYTVDVEFRDHTGNVYATAQTAIDNLPPGESANWRAASGAQLAPEGSCDVAKVQTLPIV